MTATLTYDRTQPLPADAKEALDRLLLPLGVRTEGVQGSTLVLKVYDISRAPQDDFQGALQRVLNSPDIKQYWDQFDSAVYN